MFIAIEYLPNGELFDLLMKSEMPLSEGMILHFAHQLFRSLDFIHSKGISHGDLKLENIMLDEKYNLKLIDFGFARDHQNKKTYMEKFYKGTQGYAAPEVVEGQVSSSPTADVFSAGVILFMLMLRHRPFNEATISDNLYKYIVNNRADLFWKWHETKLV